jgi:hypothetical protein
VTITLQELRSPSVAPVSLTDPTFRRVLAEVGEILGSAGIPYGVFGGVASSAMGRPRTTRDIDILLRPEVAGLALDVLSDRGYQVDRLDDKWIYKATKHDVVVDIIFSTRYGVHFDDEMAKRVSVNAYDGVRVCTVSAEDLLIIKAIACDEASPKHWYDALGLMIGGDLDWNYLVRRSLRGQRRVLSLLLYAQSIDYFVPERVIRCLTARLTEAPDDT